MGSSGEALSEARLQEIRVKAYDAYDWDDWKARAMLGELLTEHDRMAAEVKRLRGLALREHEDRTREYDFANADGEIAAKRIRELLAEVERLRAREAALVAQNEQARTLAERVASMPYFCFESIDAAADMKTLASRVLASAAKPEQGEA